MGPWRVMRKPRKCREDATGNTVPNTEGIFRLLQNSLAASGQKKRWVREKNERDQVHRRGGRRNMLYCTQSKRQPQDKTQLIPG